MIGSTLTGPSLLPPIHGTSDPQFFLSSTAVEACDSPFWIQELRGRLTRLSLTSAPYCTDWVGDKCLRPLWTQALALALALALAPDWRPGQVTSEF